MTVPHIPMANPAAMLPTRQEAILAAMRKVVESGWYILGPEVERFETRFAAWLGGEGGQSVGVANGTDAIELALRALLVSERMPCEARPAVFTVSHTAVATVAAIERAGCVPVLVDIDEASYTLSPTSLEESIEWVRSQRPELTPFAVIPVHLYGHACDMNAILPLARRHGLKVVEDCAQAHGATHAGRRVGTLGDAAAFSFYPTKNLGALGDAGGVYTAQAPLAETMRALRQYGWRERYISAEAGINSRMDPVQAGILNVQLDYLDEDNAARKAHALRYADMANRANRVTLPAVRNDVGHVFHLYVVRCAERDALAKHLTAQGIGTGVHYPQPVHVQPAYAGRVCLAPEGLPVTEKIAGEILSLPMFPQLSDEDVQRVVQAVRSWSA